MLTVHSGPFHPQLEDAFAERIRSEARPFRRLAVVAPSGRLRDRAQLLLAERGLSAAGLHFHTIGSLADEVVWHAGGVLPEKGKKTPPEIVSDPLFFDTLVRIILKEDRPFESGLDLAVPEGFPPSVRATLRDLIDAGVEPGALLAAVNEREQFDIPEVDAGSLKQLIHLFQLYLNRMATLNVASRSAVMKRAAEAAAVSPLLAGFEEIFFYGFYDLTGLQAAFFEEVGRHHSTHLFFPYLHKHPDHEFAGRFRGDILHKIPHDEILLTEAEAPFYLHRGPGEAATADGPLARIVRWEDGLEAAVANVSGLRDEAWTIATEVLRRHEAGVPFSEIAVVARTRERLARFGPVFEERGIPFVTAWQRTLADAPQVDLGLQLLTAAMGGPAAADASRSPDLRDAPAEPAPAAWSASAPWPDHVDRLLALLDARLKPEAAIKPVWKGLREAALLLKEFQRLGKTVSRGDFAEAVRARWTSLPAGPEGGGVGVALLHGEAARGLSFDTVLLAGVEERVFPRVVREDPFLRDKVRHAITHTIGNKIGEKMLALAEERLLLSLILSSARRRLVVTYQRSDDEGKIVGASSFLRRLLSEWGVASDAAVNVVPRRLTDRLAATPPSTLGARDLVSGLLMAGRAADAAAFVAAIGQDGAALARGAAVTAALEKWEDPGGFDGLVGAEIGARHLAEAGLSPSGLESFARCPFQFFVGRVLRLRPPEEAASPEEIAADVRGKLVHKFLEIFYHACADAHPAGWPAVPPDALFDTTFDAVFAARPPEVFPLLWNAIRNALRIQLHALVSADFRVLSERGLRPAFFERAQASASLDPALGGVRIQGIMDRLDVGKGRARVVDYKTGAQPGLRLPTLVLRGQKAQPPVYLMLAADLLKPQGVPAESIDFAYLHLNAEEPLTELSAAEWLALRAGTLDTLKTEVDLIAAGRFPILPGRYCEWCDAAAVCRVNDSVSAFRTEPASADLRRVLRKKPAAKEKA